jgi:hypothetical protein
MVARRATTHRRGRAKSTYLPLVTSLVRVGVALSVWGGVAVRQFYRCSLVKFSLGMPAGRLCHKREGGNFDRVVRMVARRY